MKVSIYVMIAGCLLLSQEAFAQPEKGCLMIGGGAGFTSRSFGDFNSSTIYLAPQVGYFFTDRLAAGAQLSMYFFGGDSDGSRIGLGPYVRYYFNGSGPARFYGQAGIAFSTVDPGDNFDSYTNFGFDIGAGVDYFLNDNVALEGMLNFNSNKNEDADDSETNIGFTIGVAAFLCKR